MPIRRLAATACAAAALAAGDATAPGTVAVPHPTTCGISIEWPFTGDANGDARVSLRYRPAGGAWKAGMPLFRIPAGATDGVSWGDRHCGSIFDLDPATTYDIELTLVDPDGGGTVRTLSVATRALPAAASGARVRAATPATFAAQWAAAQPGDIIDLGAGTYAGFTWDKDGAVGQPIVLRSTAGALVDGNIDMFSRHDVILDGLSVNGRIRFNGSARIAVLRCTVNARADRGGGDCIVSYIRSEDCYIADNSVTGTSVWAEASLGAGGANLGDGVEVSGPGHVIRNNRVRGFRDGIALMEGDLAFEQVGIDILENDIGLCCDDGIQADSTAGNCRVVRNRLTNCFMGISSQPSRGGPLYLVRNAMYNIVFEAFKLHNATYGDVLLHNTVVKAGDAFSVFSGAGIYRTYARNNLFIGGPGGTFNGYDIGSGKVMNLWDLDTASASLDYDGYGSAGGTVAGRCGPSVSFASLAQLRSLTSEAHAVQVGAAVFATAITVPASPLTTFTAPDLRLAAAGAAVDAGIAIPGINDGFAGAAPDLGAYERGAALPVYGPRSPGPADPGVPPLSGGGSTSASGGAGGGCGAGAAGAALLLAMLGLRLRRR